MERIQDDIIVIGGGIAGIVASLELLSAGRSVTLLDRDIEENFGGLAKKSFGGLFVVDSAEHCAAPTLTGSRPTCAKSAPAIARRTYSPTSMA